MLYTKSWTPCLHKQPVTARTRRQQQIQRAMLTQRNPKTNRNASINHLAPTRAKSLRRVPGHPTSPEHGPMTTSLTSNQQNTAHRRSKTHAPRNTRRQLGDGKNTKCWRRAHSHTKVLTNMANTRRTLPKTTCSVAPTHPHRHTHTHIHTQSHSHVHLPSHTPTLTPTLTVTQTHTHTLVYKSGHDANSIAMLRSVLSRGSRRRCQNTCSCIHCANHMSKTKTRLSPRRSDTHVPTNVMCCQRGQLNCLFCDCATAPRAAAALANAHVHAPVCISMRHRLMIC